MENFDLPEQFVRRIRQQLAAEADAFFHSLKQPGPVSIRLNPSKRADIQGEPVPWSSAGIYLPERPSFVADPLFHAGAYYVQEASSMVIELACRDALHASPLHASPDMGRCNLPLRILDLCAAPGGKSTLLAGLMPPGSLLVSNEVIASRAAILAENMTRWGHPEVIVTQNDPKAFGFLDEYFDLVVVDAPCSGEGMFRKDPAAIAEWSPDNVTSCASRQQRILRDIAPTVKPGGLLVYSTCTFAPQEDEEMIHWLLEELGADFELAPFSLDPAWGWDSLKLLGVDDAAHRAWPHRVRGEGLFICRFRRKGEKGMENKKWKMENEGDKKGKKKKNKKAGKGNGKNGGNDWQKEVFPFTGELPGIRQEGVEDKVFLYPEAVARAIPLFTGSLRMLKKGVLAGKLHRKGFAPSHELALSSLLSESVPRLALDRESALRFLQKEDLTMADLERSGGEDRFGLSLQGTAHWLLPTYQGIPLGWAKKVGHKLKNQLPVNWRIRRLRN